MPLNLRTSYDAGPLIPDEEYLARLVSFVEEDNPYYKPEAKDPKDRGEPTRFTVTYEITETVEIDGQEYENLTVKEWLGTFSGFKKDGSESKTLNRLRTYCKALGLPEPDPRAGIDLDEEDIGGAKVRINIEHYTKGGVTKYRVAGVKPVRKGSRIAMPAEPADDADPENLPF